ncbi:MAG: serine/threonine-protein kinase [Planctomycetaceae bacterium]
MNDFEPEHSEVERRLRELAVWRRLMEVCQRYEAAYQRGERPQLSQLANEFSESDRVMALEELQRVHTELAEEQVTGSTAINGRFVVLEPLARGGMGEVSIARDEELQRDVAFKEIRSSAADDHRYRSRFLREAEITAQLEHPGIIPVYARGERECGRPYYVMRLIRGDRTGTLHDSIRELHDPGKTPSSEYTTGLRRLVRRLVDVCNTMAYAHSRGVIHRDLKPANILLGAYGETLVVDWGLARLIEIEPAVEKSAVISRFTAACDTSETPGTSGIGTPGYASPEQLGLHNSVVNPSADVYSLGTILYSLLTGRAPFSTADSSSPEQLVERVAAGRFPPPRALNPEAPRALEAICLRAMQTVPQQRYSSASAFAVELERWLSDEPVQAWVEPLTARFRRWLLRHKTIAAVGTGALLISIPALILLVMLQADYTRTMKSRQSQLTTALEDNKQQQQRIQAARAHAEAQRQRAESREQMAIVAVDKFRSAIAEEPLLQNSAELTELRTRLLTQPLPFYRQLAQQLQPDRETSPESVLKFAQVNLALAEQHVFLGEWQTAVELLTNSIALLQVTLPKVAPRSDVSRDMALVLAMSLQEQGNISEQRRNAAAEAESQLRESLTTLERIIADFPAAETTAARYAAVDVRSSLAAMLGKNNRCDEAAALLREAIRLCEQSDSLPEASVARRVQLADLHSNLGVTLVGLERFEEAAQAYKAAAAVFNTIEQRFGPTPRLTHRKAGVLFNQARMHELDGRIGQALREHIAALGLRRSLNVDYPTVHDYRLVAFASRDRVVDLQLKTGAIADALATGRDWVEDARKISERSPGHLQFRIELLDSLHSLGHMHAVVGRILEAEPFYREALAINSEVREREPVNTIRERNHAELLEHVAQLDFHHGKFSEARLALEQAIPLQRDWIKNNPTRPLDTAFLKQMLDTLARCCEKLNEPDAAAAARSEAAKLR